MTDNTACDENSELLQRWKDKWVENKIAWHKCEAHPALIKYLPAVLEHFQSEKIRVLVPLCGKTKDLVYLANHPSVAEVVGIEGVQKAYDELMEEHPELNISKEENKSSSSFLKFVGNKITLLKGNFFDLDNSKECIPEFDLVWDRASIVAINPNKRQEYVKVITQMLKPGAWMLFGTVDRRDGSEEAMKKGPPFTVTDKDLYELYQSVTENCAKLEEHDEIQSDPIGHKRYSDQGLKSFFEVVTLIKTK